MTLLTFKDKKPFIVENSKTHSLLFTSQPGEETWNTMQYSAALVPLLQRTCQLLLGETGWQRNFWAEQPFILNIKDPSSQPNLTLCGQDGVRIPLPLNAWRSKDQIQLMIKHPGNYRLLKEKEVLAAFSVNAHRAESSPAYFTGPEIIKNAPPGSFFAKNWAEVRQETAPREIWPIFWILFVTFLIAELVILRRLNTYLGRE
jgi:hypothetical protein